MPGTRRKCWCTMPSPARDGVGGRSERASVVRRPAGGQRAGAGCPKATCSSVLLPAPFSPSSACSEPRGTVSVASRSATVAPKRSRHVLERESGGARTCPHRPRVRARPSLTPSESGRRGDERPRQAEALLQPCGHRAHAERLGRVVAGVDDDEAELRRLDRRVVRSLAGDERVDAGLTRLAQRLAGRAAAGEDRPATRACADRCSGVAARRRRARARTRRARSSSSGSVRALSPRTPMVSPLYCPKPADGVSPSSRARSTLLPSSA